MPAGRPRSEQKTIKVKVPKNEIKRFRRRWNENKPEALIYTFDFRGIRNNPEVHSKIRNAYDGIPAALQSPEQCQKLVNEYFESCNGPLLDKFGHVVRDDDGQIIKTQVKPYTISGLSYALGFSTTWALNRYARGDFDDLGEPNESRLISTILQRAKQVVESYVESRLYDRDGSNGARFVLDAGFKWKTQKEAAEIRKMEFEQWKAYKELELKQQLQAMGEEDNTIQIQIVRKTEEE